MAPCAITNRQTNSSIRTTTCNFLFELQCRHTRKNAKALGMKSRKARTAPPAQCSPKSTDKMLAIANPTKARDCGVFKMNDPISLGRDTSRISTARISSMR